MRDSRFVVPALCCGLVALIIAACGGGSSSGGSGGGGGGGGGDTDGGGGGDTDGGNGGYEASTTPTIDGGNCGRDSTLCPTGAACKGTPDCVQGDICDSNVCNVPPATCTDGKKDGSETDVDCGGTCPQCPDGKTCGAAADCVDGVCNVTCQAPSCTDTVQNGNETGVDCGGTCPKCADGGGCKTGADCASGSCSTTTHVCLAPTCSDSIKNGAETDVDCGGGTCPVCAVGKGCGAPTDCFWGHCNANVCGGHVLGTKDGDETDINCGGTQSLPCDWFQSCLVDKDCASKVCDANKVCEPGESCRQNTHGITTCGLGEVGFPPNSHTTAAGALVDGFETCCKSLPVAGYSDPNQVGKKVYLDKYEITAGRMRAFVAWISNGNGGTPDIKTWTAAHRPARWNNGWEEFLPQANFGINSNYTVTNPTGANLLNPGQDQYLINHYTQSTWSVGTGNFAVDMGIFYAFGGVHFFPEYITQSGVGWPTPDYAAAHALNCGNAHGQYGWSTYWMDAATAAYSGGVGKAETQDILDEKSMNCSPNAVFAAFCAWDGGQLATAEVMDAITGNTVQPIYDGGYPNGKYSPGASTCGPGGNTLNTFSDGTQGCYSLPNGSGYYPGPSEDYDDSSKITSPGRVQADVISINAADEPWMDMIGNLQEAVLKRGETIRFDYRGYGAEYGSITHHKNQQTTPRYKSGAMGARCMRFK